MKHLLFGLLLGTALVAAQGAVALTLAAPGQNLQDPTAKAFNSDGDAPIQHLTPQSSGDNTSNTIFRSRDGAFSMGITPFSNGGAFGGDNQSPYATNSPFWGMERGSGFRTLNQQ
jgi:hypothetical protein